MYALTRVAAAKLYRVNGIVTIREAGGLRIRHWL